MTLTQSSDRTNDDSSKYLVEFLAAGRAAVNRYCWWLVRPSALSWDRNSLASRVALCRSAGPKSTLPPASAVGYSQSRSIPSKTPAAAPAPPACSGQPPVGRSPLMNVLMQAVTNACRRSLVAATLLNQVDFVQPPSEISIFRWGYLALSLRSWLKLPKRCWLGSAVESATPSTESVVPAGRWKSAHGSRMPQPTAPVALSKVGTPNAYWMTLSLSAGMSLTKYPRP